MESLVLLAVLLLVTVVVVATPSLVFALRPPRHRVTRVFCYLFATPALLGGLVLLFGVTGPFRAIGLIYAVAAPVSVLRSIRLRQRISGPRGDAADHPSSTHTR